MKTVIKRAAVATLSVGMLGAVATAVAEPASATPGPGVVCHVNQNTQVFSGPGNGDRIYTIAKDDAFRVLYLHHDGAGRVDYLYGHGNGHSDGYAVNDDRYYAC